MHGNLHVCTDFICTYRDLIVVTRDQIRQRNPQVMLFLCSIKNKLHGGPSMQINQSHSCQSWLSHRLQAVLSHSPYVFFKYCLLVHMEHAPLPLLQLGKRCKHACRLLTSRSANSGLLGLRVPQASICVAAIARGLPAEKSIASASRYSRLHLLIPSKKCTRCKGVQTEVVQLLATSHTSLHAVYLIGVLNSCEQMRVLDFTTCWM